MSNALPIPQIDAAEASRRVAAGAVLLDVREPEEWQAGHAPAARHLPMAHVPEKHTSIPPDADVVIVCRSGGRSQRVAEWLSAQGYAPANLAGGMQAWAAGGLPVVTDGGQPGTVA